MRQRFKTGKNNSITDVHGVTVGHVTYNTSTHQTGVTAIKAHSGNHFQNKLIAASHIMNGFGKSVGLIQIDELGQLETPIILTNTLSVGTCTQGLIEYMLKDNPTIGRETGSINSTVCECNDGYLNDIRTQVITEADVTLALDNATTIFKRGAIGAGRGMSCYELKGGIGTASRIIPLGDKDYTLGTLVLSNFGRLPDLTIDGERIGEQIQASSEHEDKGSIIVIVATDLPVDSRQLNRIIKRTAVGIARTGSYIGNGSGEIAVGFSTATTIPHEQTQPTLQLEVLHEDKLEQVFSACSEATEAAIIDSMLEAEATVGRDGHKRATLADYYQL